MNDYKTFEELLSEIKELKNKPCMKITRILTDQELNWLQNVPKLMRQASCKFLMNELKEQYNHLEDRYKESGGLKCSRDRHLIKEVLRELKRWVSSIIYGLWRKEVFFTAEYNELYNKGLEIESKLDGEKSDGSRPPNKTLESAVRTSAPDSKPPECEFYDMNADYCTKYDLRGS